MLCVICGECLSGRQTKYCSNKCKCKDTNKHAQSYRKQKERALKRKIMFVEELGGCCSVCGYDSNYASLLFHHVDSCEKRFKLDSRSLSNRTLVACREELLKCVLLCANCHGELHYPDYKK